MPQRFRQNWSQKIDEVIHARRYTWLGRGLGGDALKDAMATLAADLMHICERRVVGGSPREREQPIRAGRS